MDSLYAHLDQNNKVISNPQPYKITDNDIKLNDFLTRYNLVKSGWIYSENKFIPSDENQWNNLIVFLIDIINSRTECEVKKSNDLNYINECFIKGKLLKNNIYTFVYNEIDELLLYFENNIDSNWPEPPIN